MPNVPTSDVPPTARATAHATAHATDALVTRALEVLHDHLARGEAAPTLRELGGRVGASPAHLQRRFTAVVGVSPHEWMIAHQAAAARAALRHGADVSGAAMAAGFGSLPRAQEQLTRALGMPPGRYRRGGEGERLAFTGGDSALGEILLAATPRGICWLAIGESADALHATFAAEWPRATHLPASDQAVAEETRALLARGLALARALADGKPIGTDAASNQVPLDLRGTAFQLRVWNALQQITRGTRSDYASLARAIGSPSAVRAVGTACGANPVALIVPCHRVVRRDGALGGYRWGIQRKAALLAAEHAA